MTQEEIDKMSLADYEEHKKTRMGKNAWEVANGVTRRVDGAPVLSEFIKAFVSDEAKDMPVFLTTVICFMSMPERQK